MIDSNVLQFLDTSAQTKAKSKPQKSQGVGSSAQSTENDKQSFSGYMEKNAEKPPVQASEKSQERASEKSAVKDNVRGSDNEKSKVKVEENESDTAVEKTTATTEDEAEVTAVATDADDENALAVETDKLNVEVKVEDEVEPSTAALVNLLLQRAIKSNVGEGTEKPKGLDNAILATQQHSAALEALVQKRASIIEAINQNPLINEELKQSIEKLTPGLAKLLLSDGKEAGNENKLPILNGKQELLSQIELKPVDEALDIKEENSDLMSKFLEKLDLSKNKGEAIFHNKMVGDKAAVTAELPEINLNRMSTESVDKNVLLNSMNNSERLNTSSAIQQAKMNVPMTNPDWGVEFGKRIQMLMKNNIQHAEIRMDPPGLGSIQVRINMNQDQANISFTALHANVREAIETNMNRLRDMLGDTGLQLGETDVNPQFQQQTNQRSDEQSQFSMKGQGESGSDDSEVTEMPAAMVQHSIDGVIDYFA